MIVLYFFDSDGDEGDWHLTRSEKAKVKGFDLISGCKIQFITYKNFNLYGNIYSGLGKRYRKRDIHNLRKLFNYNEAPFTPYEIQKQQYIVPVLGIHLGLQYIF